MNKGALSDTLCRLIYFHLEDCRLIRHISLWFHLLYIHFFPELATYILLQFNFSFEGIAFNYKSEKTNKPYLTSSHKNVQWVVISTWWSI